MRWDRPLTIHAERASVIQGTVSVHAWVTLPRMNKRYRPLHLLHAHQHVPSVFLTLWHGLTRWRQVNRLLFSVVAGQRVVLPPRLQLAHECFYWSNSGKLLLLLSHIRRELVNHALSLRQRQWLHHVRLLEAA